MARGKITTYEQGGFSRQAVGTPGVDRSGAIIGQGIESIGDALIKRQEASDNLTAMDRYGDFEFQNTQKKFELQRKYQNDPEKYVTAAKEESMKLADELSKGMSGGAARKFKELSIRSIAQDAEGNARWAFARDNEIQVGKITSIKQNIALKASAVSSPQDLMAIKADFEAVAPEAQKFISKEDDDKLTKTHWELAKKNAMNAQLMASPNKLKADLDGHAYDGILDPDEIKTYSDQARNAIMNRAIDDQYRTLFAAEDKTLNFVKGLDDGSVNIVDLISEREAVYANRKKAATPEAQAVTKAYLDNLDALIAGQTQSMSRTPFGKEKREAVLGEFTRKWDAYLTEKRDAQKRPDASDLSKELELFKSLQDAYQSGVIDRNDFYDKVAIMTTKKSLAKNDIGGAMPFEKAVNEAGAVSGWWLWKKGNDVISTGYRQIREQVDKQYPELLPDERTMLKAQMLSQYHQQVKDTPPEQLQSLSTDNQREAFARGILFGGTNSAGNLVPGIMQKMASLKTPEKTYHIGDVRKDDFGNDQVFSGKDPSGQPIWKFKPGTTIRGPGGKTALVKPDGTLEQQ